MTAGAPSDGGSGERCVGIIPARLGSTRFPGKVLADRTGKPLIQHVWESARRARSLARVVIATDDESVAVRARGFGAECVLTRVDHPNGTSRIAEAADMLRLAPGQIVVNIQGDEPELEGAVVDAGVEAFLRLERTTGARMGTVASPMNADEPADDPNVVKVVVSDAGMALYFSRSRIPFDRDSKGGADAACLRHIGLYVYREAFLSEYAQLPSSSLERAEQLEQLRALQAGVGIAVGICRSAHTGIDTPAQYDEFVRRTLGQG